MRFLADENVHKGIVTWLRECGHDVLFAAELLASQADKDLLALAQADDRILITDDKDFGELVFHRRLVSRGVLLIRIEAPDLGVRLKRLADVWTRLEAELPGRFLVLSDRKLRGRPIPKQTSP